MPTSLHLWRSPLGKPTNTFCCVWKELPLVGDLASPSRRRKWAIAHVAQLLPTLLRHHRMMLAPLMKPNARAPPSGNSRAPGLTAILRHTNTGTPMVPCQPIGIGQRPHWTLRHPPRYRSPICMKIPRIPHRTKPLCMRNRHQAPGKSNHWICRGPLLHYIRRLLCPHRVIDPRL